MPNAKTDQVNLKMCNAMAGATFSLKRGDKVTRSKEIADAWVKAGIAELYEDPQESAEETRASKATSRSPSKSKKG